MAYITRERYIDLEMQLATAHCHMCLADVIYRHPIVFAKSDDLANIGNGRMGLGD